MRKHNRQRNRARIFAATFATITRDMTVVREFERGSKKRPPHMPRSLRRALARVEMAKIGNAQPAALASKQRQLIRVLLRRMS